MYKKLSVLCVIPARGGSKGLPGKNTKVLAGKPLIAHTIAHARASRLVDRVIVSTESPAIARIAQRWGAETPFRRPASLARDASGAIDVLLHAVNWVKREKGGAPDVIVLLLATTPLRAPSDIDNCIRLLVDKKADSVFSVTEAHRNPYFNMVELSACGRVRLCKPGRFTTRQAAPPVYDMNASVYVWWRRTLESGRRTIQPASRIYVMPKERSVDIDDALDFALAQALLKARKK